MKQISRETQQKLKEATKRNWANPEFRKRMSDIKKERGIVPPSWLGKKRGKRTEEHQQHWLEANKGKHNHTEEWKKEQSKKMLGKKNALGFSHTEEHKEYMSKKLKGKNSHLWKGGITPLIKMIRNCREYKVWRTYIFNRDNYTCQMCDKRGSYSHVNHIKTFASILQKYNTKTFEEALLCEELWNTNNGITLCKECHKLITKHEAEWESYFIFNLKTRGFVEDEFISVNNFIERMVV